MRSNLARRGTGDFQCRLAERSNRRQDRERRYKMNETREKIIQFLEETSGAYRPVEIAKRIGVTKKQIMDAIDGWDMVEMSRIYGHLVFVPRVKSSPVPGSTINKLKGEYKPDTAMKIAMDRCRESRGGELHTIAVNGGEKMYNATSGEI